MREFRRKIIQFIVVVGSSEVKSDKTVRKLKGREFPASRLYSYL